MMAFLDGSSQSALLDEGEMKAVTWAGTDLLEAAGDAAADFDISSFFSQLAASTASFHSQLAASGQLAPAETAAAQHVELCGHADVPSQHARPQGSALCGPGDEHATEVADSAADVSLSALLGEHAEIQEALLAAAEPPAHHPPSSAAPPAALSAAPSSLSAPVAASAASLFAPGASASRGKTFIVVKKPLPAPPARPNNNNNSNIRPPPPLPGPEKRPSKRTRRRPTPPYGRPPPAPLTAYNIFFKEQYAVLKSRWRALNPQRAVPKLAKDWARMTEGEKGVYLKRAETGREEYRQRLAEYRQRARMWRKHRAMEGAGATATAAGTAATVAVGDADAAAVAAGDDADGDVGDSDGEDSRGGDSRVRGRDHVGSSRGGDIRARGASRGAVPGGGDGGVSGAVHNAGVSASVSEWPVQVLITEEDGEEGEEDGHLADSDVSHYHSSSVSNPLRSHGAANVSQVSGLSVSDVISRVGDVRSDVGSSSVSSVRQSLLLPSRVTSAATQLLPTPASINVLSTPAPAAAAAAVAMAETPAATRASAAAVTPAPAVITAEAAEAVAADEEDADDIHSDDDPADLYCSLCRQFFSSTHNKRQHLLSRGHVRAMAHRAAAEEAAADRRHRIHHRDSDYGPNSESESGPDSDSDSDSESRESESLAACSDVTSAVESVLHAASLREAEIAFLTEYSGGLQRRQQRLKRQLEELEERRDAAVTSQRAVTSQHGQLTEQVQGLLLVPTLFGVMRLWGRDAHRSATSARCEQLEV